MKENVCKLNTCCCFFFTKAISLHKNSLGVIYGQLFHNIIVWVPYGSLVKSSCDGIRRKVPMRFIYHHKYYVIYFYMFLIQFYKFVLFLKSITKLVKHCNKNDKIKACVVEPETAFSREN